MPYTLVYHPRVVEEDLPPLPLNVQRRIARALAERLTSAPEQHGVPLKRSLKGYWKLRIGDYRVVYKIAGRELLILGIIHRKKVYEEVLRRIVRRPL